VQWPKDNTPRFRDGKAWPEAIVGANRDPKGRPTGTEGGFTIINARRIWDAEPDHTTTDIILLDGDPTKNIYEMLKTKVVLKAGNIVVDKRPTASRR
jgi:hypothetical protein